MSDSYSPPTGDSLELKLVSTSYSPPVGDNIDFIVWSPALLLIKKERMLVYAIRLAKDYNLCYDIRGISKKDHCQTFVYTIQNDHLDKFKINLTQRHYCRYQLLTGQVVVTNDRQSQFATRLEFEHVARYHLTAPAPPKDRLDRYLISVGNDKADSYIIYAEGHKRRATRYALMVGNSGVSADHNDWHSIQLSQEHVVNYYMTQHIDQEHVNRWSLTLDVDRQGDYSIARVRVIKDSDQVAGLNFYALCKQLDSSYGLSLPILKDNHSNYTYTPPVSVSAGFYSIAPLIAQVQRSWAYNSVLLNTETLYYQTNNTYSIEGAAYRFIITENDV